MHDGEFMALSLGSVTPIAGILCKVVKIDPLKGEIAFTPLYSSQVLPPAQIPSPR